MNPFDNIAPLFPEGDDRNNHRNGGSDGGGNGMLEVRVAKLEADVENIKINLAETRADVRELTKITSSIKTDVSTILQKLVDIDEKLSHKASKDFVEVKTGNLKAWMLGILLLSVAMPVITLLVNLYMKKP
ncbi:TPA: hypothetical protein ACYTKB_003941 [Escherichia coli]|uniref:hypothetical protein n=1 Tax=Escherichia coli TaxID=562 RepID=UPI0010E9DC7C|nr:hypothetical protein [Escherichia coli]MCE3724050.1 hypothetical protein [Escherichia coli]MCL0893711.1 hypothetical protein [Escherichia coli]MCN3463768.1 hypothetical protein [Escherichia coli]MCU9718574.1 hypothetical protein [Escherichia coli]MCU9721810.1 hypothetical protein [Escherichia coli]